jgi:hypothetical protein
MTVVQSLKMKSKLPTLRLGYILVCLAVSIADSHPANRRLTQTRRGRRLRVLALLGRDSNTVVYFEPAKHHSKKLEQGKTKPRKLLQLIEPFDKMRHWNPSDRVSLQMSADANKGE